MTQFRIERLLLWLNKALCVIMRPTPPQYGQNLKEYIVSFDIVLFSKVNGVKLEVKLPKLTYQILFWHSKQFLFVCFDKIWHGHTT